MKVRKRALLGAAAIACGCASVACNALIGWQSNYVETDGGVDGQPPSPEAGPPGDGGADAPVLDAPTGDAPMTDAPPGDAPTSDGPTTCTPACTSGATQCASPATVQTCSGTCWSAPTACPSDAGVLPYVCEQYSGSCADPDWAEWPVPNSSVDSPPAPNLQSYTDNGDGTITDNVTKLMWQKTYAGATATWTNAVLNCELLSLAGHQDWRLPTVIELSSIIDFTLGPPKIPINATYFVGMKNFNYWTSTPAAGTSPPQAWTVEFYEGQAYPDFETHADGYICVR
jgi:hypothetical protein